jgi:hypothetical protein
MLDADDLVTEKDNPSHFCTCADIYVGRWAGEASRAVERRPM